MTSFFDFVMKQITEQACAKKHVTINIKMYVNLLKVRKSNKGSIISGSMQKTAKLVHDDINDMIFHYSKKENYTPTLHVHSQT